MLRKIRNRLTYANVMSTLAVFIALGGTSFTPLWRTGPANIKNNAVRSVDLRNNDVRGKDVRNGTLTGVDVKRDALGGSVIAELRLGKVPAKGTQAGDGGRSVEELRVRCPAGTVERAGVCFRGVGFEPAVVPGGFHDQCALRGRLNPTSVQTRAATCP